MGNLGAMSDTPGGPQTPGDGPDDNNPFKGTPFEQIFNNIGGFGGLGGLGAGGAMPDLNAREYWLLAPIAAAVLWMGDYPESFLRPMRADVGRLLERIERAAPESDAQVTAGKPAPAAAKSEAHSTPAEAH